MNASEWHMRFGSLPDNLDELFYLDGDVLRWKVARGRVTIGSVAGRRQIRIDGVLYARSRIVEYLRNGLVSDYRKVTDTTVQVIEELERKAGKHLGLAEQYPANPKAGLTAAAEYHGGRASAFLEAAYLLRNLGEDQ